MTPAEQVLARDTLTAAADALAPELGTLVRLASMLPPSVIAMVSDVLRALAAGTNPIDAIERVAEEHARTAAIDEALTKAKG